MKPDNLSDEDEVDYINSFFKRIRKGGRLEGVAELVEIRIPVEKWAGEHEKTVHFPTLELGKWEYAGE